MCCCCNRPGGCCAAGCGRCAAAATQHTCLQVPPELPEPSIGINFARCADPFMMHCCVWAAPCGNASGVLILPRAERTALHVMAALQLALLLSTARHREVCSRRALIASSACLRCCRGGMKRSDCPVLVAVQPDSWNVPHQFVSHRDGMTRSDWLSLVAVHSDSWLMAVAVYNAARLNANGRRQLFNGALMCKEMQEVFAVGDSAAGLA